ncbi:glycosyltransferase family 2 protein [Flavobacteriaceae bacterium S0862]|nr:glycosyltransferase family 2 protein [Flavobacteriaceae bacterium S0862]
MNKNVNVKIIIVTYNGMQWLARCLSSCIGYDVIVVDNASTDETITFIKENFPNIKLIRQNSNLGFGQANNIGLSIALKECVDYVFLLNQDAYLQPGTINDLIETHKKNNIFGILSPIHLNGDASNLDKNFSNYIKENNDIIFDALLNKFSKEIYSLPFVNAAAWLLPRKTIETIGGFDPIFFHYTEDDNYCQRLLFHDMKIGVVPNTYIYHDRDNKKTNDRPINEKERLVLKERYFKHRWANINVEIDKDLKRNKKDLLKLIVKLYLKLKFNKALYYQKELALINRIVPEIYKSRAKNATSGPHYLEVIK